MTDSNNLVATLFGGSLLALDRSALPTLTARASMRLAERGGLAHAERHHAALMDGFETAGDPAVRQVGSTAIVPLIGFITPDPFLAWLLGGTTPDGLVRALRTATAEREVTNIILLTDSPGGHASLIPETCVEIRRLGGIKPITAISRTMMCSAAYWLASQASAVIATPSADVGSVGCFICHVEESRMLDRIGVKVTYIASAPEKVEANAEEPLTDEAQTFLRQRVMEVYGAFVADVARGRKTTEANIRAHYGNGRAFGAAESLRRGLVDRVGTLDSLLPASARRSGANALSEAIQTELQDCDMAIRIAEREARALGTADDVTVDVDAVSSDLDAATAAIAIAERAGRA
jgi:signal peptide peptidase SppA